MLNCFIVNLTRGKQERECRVVTNVSQGAFKATTYRNKKFIYMTFGDFLSGKTFAEESGMNESLVWRVEEIVEGWRFKLKPDEIISLERFIFEMTT